MCVGWVKLFYPSLIGNYCVTKGTIPSDERYILIITLKLCIFVSQMRFSSWQNTVLLFMG